MREGNDFLCKLLLVVCMLAMATPVHVFIFHLCEAMTHAVRLAAPVRGKHDARDWQ